MMIRKIKKTLVLSRDPQEESINDRLEIQYMVALMRKHLAKAREHLQRLESLERKSVDIGDASV